MGLFQTKALEMAAMAIINHTEEELDDDIVSNLSLNLMVSDNEDDGSPNSDRFEKLDSRNESPEDSNNFDNNEEAKMNCDDLCTNELKDDLHHLRAITGDSCWSAVDDADSTELPSVTGKDALNETENNEATSLDTEQVMDEDNTKVMLDNSAPITKEEKTVETHAHLNYQNTAKELVGEDEEMENEERLLNDARDIERDTFDCENLDEDALLSDPRDEDLLQVTEEKTTESDTADFLKSCQEEQDTNENSSSSTEKADDNQSDYDESNTDALQPELEPDDTISNDNYEMDTDKDEDASDDLNLVKSDDEELQEEGRDRSEIVNELEDEESKINEPDSIVLPEESFHEHSNAIEDKGCVVIEQSTEVEESSKHAVMETEPSVGSEIDNEVSLSVIESGKETVPCNIEPSAKTDSSDMCCNSEVAEIDITSNNMYCDGANADCEIDQVVDLVEGSTIETPDLPEEGKLLIERRANEHTSIENKQQQLESNAATEEVTHYNDDLDAEEITNDHEQAIEEIAKVNEELSADTIEEISEEELMPTQDVIHDNNEDTANDNDSEVTEDIAKDNVDQPIEDITNDDAELTTEDMHDNEALATVDITSDTEGLAIKNTTKDNYDLTTEDITGDNYELPTEEDITNDNDMDPTDNEEPITEHIANDNEELQDTVAVADIAVKPIEIDCEAMDVDDMDFEMTPIQTAIENDAPCINTDSLISTNEDKTVVSNDETGIKCKTDTIVSNEDDNSTVVVELIPNDKKNDAPILDENIINLIDDADTEVPSDVGNTVLNVQNITDAAVINALGPTIETANSDSSATTLNNRVSIGIDGDNKECEDMDIEEIAPYKELTTRPNGSVLKQMLTTTKNIPVTLASTTPTVSPPTSTDGKQKTVFIVSPISNTIADNNIAVVSPQPGEKRLSSDNYQAESAKRRRLATTSTRDVRLKYLESFKQAMASANWSRIGRRHLEEFVTQKLLETIHYKTEMGELHKKCMEYKQSLENLRANSLTLTKQLRDMNSVHIKLEREINILKARHRDDDKPLVAVKITRSVGLQALVEDPKPTRRTRPNVPGSSARTAAQKQPLQVVQQQQQQSHPPQLQQKPMIQQQQQQPMQVQVPQRVLVGAGTSPQLQARPMRSMLSVPAIPSPVQTRTMSRNKKVPNAVNSANPPPLRNINQHQPASSNTSMSMTIPTSSAISIPIKHITGPTILNKNIAVTVPSVTAPVSAVQTSATSKAVIDLTDEDDVSKRTSPIKLNPPPLQQQQRITLMSTVVNGQQVLLRVDGSGPIASKAGATLTNGGTPIFVQAPMIQQRVNANNTVKVMTTVPVRTRTSAAVQTPIQSTPAITPPSPNASRRFRHPAPLPAPPASQNLIKGNKPIPPKPTVTVNKSSNGIIVKWNMPSMLSLFEKIVRYELFVYQVTKSPPRTDSWGKINDVGALDLPMAVSLTEFAEGNRYYFAVRAVDELSRLGPFSEPQTIVF